MIKNVAYIVYPVADIERSRQFYCGVLGLPDGENWKGAWLELEIGQGTLVLTSRFDELGITPGANGALLALEVQDLDEMSARLARHGINWYLKPTEHPYCRGATVKDPDGNRVLLHQKKQITSGINS